MGVGNMSSVFNKIAPFYGLFYNFQKRHYHRILDNIKDQLDLSEYESILDIGSGTGALCSVLNDRGFSVSGVELSHKMMEVAKVKTSGEDIPFYNASVLERLPFEDKSFDITISSYVAHGLGPNDRKTMYEEMKRVTRELVIIYDYNENLAPHTTIIEWLERGDYFNFIRVIKKEMEENFHSYRTIQVGERATLYIGEVSE